MAFAIAPVPNAGRESTATRSPRSGYSRSAFRAVPPASEQAVDERGERRTFRGHEDRPQHEQKKDDRNQPPFLADFQKVPKLFDDGQFAHGDTRCFIVSNSRSAIILLPSTLR